MRVTRFAHLFALAALATASLAANASAAIIFDDFNTDEGHFASDPNVSATSVGDDATSVADRVTTDSPLEGAGHQKLVLVHDATTTPLRIRHLSGGGTHTNNASFTTSAGTDGYIGFYLKTTATGWQTSINLDGPTGATAEMQGSPSLPIIADGQWHLYEWNLDAMTGWGQSPGIGGSTSATVLHGAHTIDSIYFRDLDGTPGPTAEIYLDFVAKSDSGSIAALVPPAVPEPATLALAGMGLIGICSVARRKNA